MTCGACSAHGGGLCYGRRRSARRVKLAARRVRTFPSILGHRGSNGLAVVHGLLQPICELLLLVDLKVLRVLGLGMRLEAVVLAGGVEGRHGGHGADGRAGTGVRGQGPSTRTLRAGCPLYILRLRSVSAGTTAGPSGSRRFAGGYTWTHILILCTSTCRTPYSPRPSRTSTSPSTLLCTMYFPVPRPCHRLQISSHPQRPRTSSAFSTTSGPGISKQNCRMP